MLKYLNLLLITAGITIGADQSLAQEGIKLYDHVVGKKLEIYHDPIFEDYRGYGETPIFKEAANLYYNNYPKVPRVHAYNHNLQNTYVSVEFPRSLINAVPEEIKSKIFDGIDPKNISLFLVIQNSYEDDILLRPQYYSDRSIDHVSAAIFPLDGTLLSLEGQPEFTFFNDSVSAHPMEGQMVASPDNFKIKGFSKDKGAFFASLIIINRDFSSESKAAFTLHYLPPENQIEDLVESVKRMENLEELILIPNIKLLNHIEINDIANKLSFIQTSYKVDTKDFPIYFNPLAYIHLYPGLNNEASKIGVNALRYAEWHYSHHKYNYFPEAFNPEYYNILNPGVAAEAIDKQQDPIEYAKWHYSFYGYKGLNYLPKAFNPEYYNILNPSVAAEAIDKQQDPIEYARWHYAFFGYKGLNYLPKAFNPEYYNILNPGVAAEAIDKQQDPIEHAKWHYAFFGYKGLNYLPEAFNPEQYNILNPGVAAEAIDKQQDPIEYAKWHYAFHGYFYGRPYS